MKLAHITKIGLALASVFLLGCSATGAGSRYTKLGDATKVGAVDEGFRRAGGSLSGSIFTPLDYPAPNDQRLGSGAPGPGYWQQRADYTIDATLDTENESVQVTMRVMYWNNSPHELDYLWMQLEQNMFTTTSEGSRSRTPGGVMKVLEDDFDGGYQGVAISSQGELLEMKVYDTLGRVTLDKPISPHSIFEFEMSYEFAIPPHLRRMGAETVEDGKIFELAQWFPHVCMYDDVNGWNTMPYLGTGEFYTNYGSYDVAVTAPDTFVVAGSGELTNAGEVLSEQRRERIAQAMDSDEPVWIITPEEAGNDEPAAEKAVKTWRFHIDNARTFAWAASDAFIWDACAANISDTDGNPKAVLCQSFYPKEATAWISTHEDGGSSRAIKHSIEFYSDFLYPYQYPVMSNINGPEGGMEYPGIIFCGSRTKPDRMFGVTDHEIGHSWFPMFVGSDERRYMWQDEGFNTFINLYSRAAWFGEEVDVMRAIEQTAQIASAVHPQPIMTAPDKIWPKWAGRLAYRKPGLGLYLLREFIVGQERFDVAMRSYVDRWVFKHPQPSDFFRTISDSAGMDLDWFWRGWFMEPATLDQAISKVTRVEDGAVVAIENRGEMVMPVEMLIVYENGESERLKEPVSIWHASDRWRAVVRTNGRKIRSIMLDPDEILPDTNRKNNSWN